MKFADDDGGVHGHPDIEVISTCSKIGRPSGFCPLTQGLRVAQQQWPSAMQQAISHTSGSLAESARSGEKLVNASMSAVKITRHTDICLYAFAFIALPLKNREKVTVTRINAAKLTRSQMKRQ
jgi:hypothetical protein